jgi:hypothetical protein
MTWRHVDNVHWCCSLSTDVSVLTHRKGTCRVLLHVSAAWSWRQHNLIRFNCAPFLASCRRHRVLTVTCLDACPCAAYLKRAWWCFKRHVSVSNGCDTSINISSPLQIKVKSKLHYDRRSVSLGVKPRLGSKTRFVYCQLRFCRCGAPSLTRGRVCHLSRS